MMKMKDIPRNSREENLKFKFTTNKLANKVINISNNQNNRTVSVNFRVSEQVCEQMKKYSNQIICFILSFCSEMKIIVHSLSQKCLSDAWLNSFRVGLRLRLARETSVPVWGLASHVNGELSSCIEKVPLSVLAMKLMYYFNYSTFLGLEYEHVGAKPAACDGLLRWYPGATLWAECSV